MRYFELINFIYYLLLYYWFVTVGGFFAAYGWILLAVAIVMWYASQKLSRIFNRQLASLQSRTQYSSIGMCYSEVKFTCLHEYLGYLLFIKWFGLDCCRSRSSFSAGWSYGTRTSENARRIGCKGSTIYRRAEDCKCLDFFNTTIKYS